MSRVPFAPRPPFPSSVRQARGQAYRQRQCGVHIVIPWHVIARFLRSHVTISKADDSGQHWRTHFVPTTLRWAGRNKRSFRPYHLKTHIFPVSGRQR